MIVDTLLERLERVRQASGNNWTARCPAHKDKEPSLSISVADGRVLLMCHAGCQTFDILQAIGMQWSDIFESDDRIERDTSLYATRLWNDAVVDQVATHPYARKKQIDWDFGARRGVASGRVIGKDADCIVIPLRTWQGQLTGVECINWHGEKQTFGKKGWLVLGHPEGAAEVHLTEGWASMFAVARLRPKSFAGVVCFGKARLQQAADFACNQWRGDVWKHDEIGNVDVWDLWIRGQGEKYMKKIGVM